MESRRIVSLDRVADRERKHSGEEASEIRGARAPGRRIDLAFLGQLAFEPSPIGASERRAAGCPSIPGPAGFWAWSHRGSWAGLAG